MGETKAAYQDTPIDVYPSDWQVVRLAEACYEARDRNQSLAFDRNHIMSVDNQLGLIPSDRKLGEDYSRYKLVKHNEFAYNPMRLNVGSIGLWGQPNPCIVSPDYIVFGCNEELSDPNFIDYFRKSIFWKRQIDQSGQGSVRIRYYFRHIAEFSLPLPPLPEQQAIAEVLRTVQQAKEATEKVIAACRQLKRSLMRHLFTYGSVPYDQADQVKLKETEIGEVPEHWQTTKLEPFANKITKGSSPKWQGFDYCLHGSIFVRSQNIGWGRLELREIAYLPDQFNTEHQGSIIHENDVLLNLVGASIGRAALADKRIAGGNLNQAVGIVRLKRGLLPVFVVHFLLTEAGQAQICRQKKEIARANISLQDVRKFFVPLPSLTEQEMISNVLRALELKLAAEEQRCQTLTNLFNTLLHNLMTGKVRVV